MDDRILLSRYRATHFNLEHRATCDCGQPFCDGETVALYPWVDDEGMHTDPDVREMFCLTCHFWIIHDVMESIGR